MVSSGCSRYNKQRIEKKGVDVRCEWRMLSLTRANDGYFEIELAPHCV